MAESVILSRWYGMGDVLMALCAAHAYRAVMGEKVWLWTAPQMRELARCCPHVWVIEEGCRPPGVREVEVHDAVHGLWPGHEVDSFCRALGLGATHPTDKTLDLILPMEAYDAPAVVRARESSGPVVVVHAGAIDPNRTWPRSHWERLVDSLLWRKDTLVVLIGAEGRVFDLVIDPMAPTMRLIDAVGKLSMLETVALLRQSHALVSTDGGPIQLAGAAGCGIVGLYSVVPGRDRIPYRPLNDRVRILEPECPSFPCYHHTSGPVWVRENAMLKAAHVPDLNGILSQWCPVSPTLDDPARYACLKSQITPARVLRAISEVL